jgi:hypothetical protein
MIISLYVGGMTIRDIEHHLATTIGTQISRETISKITDAVLDAPGTPKSRTSLRQTATIEASTATTRRPTQTTTLPTPPPDSPTMASTSIPSLEPRSEYQRR